MKEGTRMKPHERRLFTLGGILLIIAGVLLTQATDPWHLYANRVVPLIFVLNGLILLGYRIWGQDYWHEVWYQDVVDHGLDVARLQRRQRQQSLGWGMAGMLMFAGFVVVAPPPENIMAEVGTWICALGLAVIILGSYYTALRLPHWRLR
jgi:hypothetical protein